MNLTLGPRCDYENCPRHREQVERSLNRRHYCTSECRDDERKRRSLALRVNQEGRSAVIRQMVEQHKQKLATLNNTSESNGNA